MVAQTPGLRAMTRMIGFRIWRAELGLSTTQECAFPAGSVSTSLLVLDSMRRHRRVSSFVQMAGGHNRLRCKPMARLSHTTSPAGGELPLEANAQRWMGKSFAFSLNPCSLMRDGGTRWGRGARKERGGLCWPFTLSCSIIVWRTLRKGNLRPLRVPAQTNIRSRKRWFSG